MEFPGGSDNFLAITGSAHPFLSGAETFHTPSLGDEEFEIPPIPLDSDVVGHFEDLGGSNGAGVGGGAAHYGVQGLEMGMGHALMEQGAGLLAMELEASMSTPYSTTPPVTIDVPIAGLLGPGQLTTIDQSELSTQLGLSLGANGGAGSGTPPPPPQAEAPPPPEERLSPPPSPTGSMQEEEAEEFRRPQNDPKLPKMTLTPPPGPCDPPRVRGKPPKKGKKKKDPNEPQKPVSAYALFFRDTQAAIKGQNPSATFGEVSKIVASMWDSLGEEQKQVYKRKTEAAKKEYLKALAAYRAILTSDPPRRRPLQAEEEVVEMVGGEFGGEADSPPGLAVELVPEDPPPPRCIRAGCGNPPVASGDWDEEYCSSECVVRHCRDVFLAWLAARNSSPNNVVFVK
ncbi:TOX high mobility group box family member 4 [Melopsittacus undulatus]|uniref:TOX high mobility group box family member 4 n=1 Tax=Melopsittacus undulatus TaxID=13146 RepID=UPI00146C3DFA|nr:TOX high mobility group box family member 4 [Melopsittacus undulatus]